MDKLNNKATEVSRRVEITNIPSILNNHNGIFISPAILDPKIGNENILLLRDETDFIYELSKLRPFKLVVRPGLEKTEYGPLIYILISIPNPEMPNRPFVIYDMTFNPNNEEHMSWINNLANQTHWHLFLFNKNNKQIEYFEFENLYNLEYIIPLFSKKCEGLETIDFWKAKKAFEMKCSIEELYERDIQIIY